MATGENGHVPDSRLMYLDGVYLTPHLVDGAETSMKLLPPQRFGPPELCYPDVESDLPGVVSMAYGKGRAIYLPWLPDWLYQRDSIPDFRDLLVSLGGAKTPVKLEGKGRVELTVGRAGQDGHFLVHVVNYTGQSNNLYDDPVEIHGLRLGMLMTRGRAQGAGLAGETTKRHERSVPNQEPFSSISRISCFLLSRSLYSKRGTTRVGKLNHLPPLAFPLPGR